MLAPSEYYNELRENHEERMPERQPASDITEVAVGHIQLGSPIGSGTYGYVRKGTWHNRPVALKRFGENIDYQSQLAAAHSMWRCVHPNINTLFGISIAQQQLLLILEYCSGSSLYEFLRSSREQIPQSTIVDSCLQILNGVDYLSSMGLNPLLSSSNVMIMLVNGSQHVLKLTDYTSTVARHYHSVVDESGRSTLWMAPETLRKERLTHKSEVWSFGVITWELFTREIPYSVSDAGLIRSVTAAVAHANLTPGIPSKMPLVLSEVCQSCWEVDTIRPEYSDIRMQLKQAALTPQQPQPPPGKRGNRVTAAARSLFKSPKDSSGTSGTNTNTNAAGTNNPTPPEPQFNFTVTPKRRAGKSPKQTPAVESKIPLLSAEGGGGDDLLSGFASMLASRTSAGAGANLNGTTGSERSYAGSNYAAGSERSYASGNERSYAGSSVGTLTPRRQPGMSGGGAGAGQHPATPTRLITTDPAIHLPTPQRPRATTLVEARSAASLQPPPGYNAAAAAAASRNHGGNPKRKSKVWGWLQKLKNLRRKSSNSTASREKAPTLSTRKAPGFTTRTTIIEKPPGGWNGGLGVQIEFDKDKQYLGAMVSSIKPGSAADMAGNIYVGDVIVGINGEMMIDADPQTVLDAFNVQGEIIVVNLAPRSQVHKVMEQWFPDGIPAQPNTIDPMKTPARSHQRPGNGGGGGGGGGGGAQGPFSPRYTQPHPNADLDSTVHEHFFPAVEQEDHDLYEFMALESSLRKEENEMIDETSAYAPPPNSGGGGVGHRFNFPRSSSATPTTSIHSRSSGGGTAGGGAGAGGEGAHDQSFNSTMGSMVSNSGTGTYDPLNSTTGSYVSGTSSDTPGREGGRRSRAPQEAYMTMENTVNDMREKLFLLDDQIMTQLETITRKERAQQNLTLVDLERVTIKEKSRPYMTNVIARAVHQHHSESDSAPATPMHE